MDSPSKENTPRTGSGSPSSLNDDKKNMQTIRVRLQWTVFLIALVYLSFVAGATIQALKPQSVARNMAMAVTYAYRLMDEDSLFGHEWAVAHSPAPQGDNPVTLHDKGRAWQGLNLVYSANRQGARLIDMDGTVVHEWHMRFDQVWKNPPHVPGYSEDDSAEWKNKIRWRRVHLYKNGDILIVFGSPATTPYGFGMVKLDKDSRILWRFSENAHHDVAVAPNGMIYTLTQRIETIEDSPYPVLRLPFINDMVAVLQPTGEKTKEISIVDAFQNSDYGLFLNLLDNNVRGDAVHANTVQYIDEEKAAALPFAEEGQILISMREMNTIAVLDPEAETIVWAMTGMWRAQHEPQILNNGHILLFDNKGHTGSGGPTRVIEFDPLGGGIEWSYAGTADDPLYSDIFGSQQRFPNGNTLIVESRNGRALEVTRDGEIVWEYRSTHRKTIDGREFVMMLTDVVRYRPEELTFLNFGDTGKPRAATDPVRN